MNDPEAPRRYWWMLVISTLIPTPLLYAWHQIQLINWSVVKFLMIIKIIIIIVYQHEPARVCSWFHASYQILASLSHDRGTVYINSRQSQDSGVLLLLWTPLGPWPQNVSWFIERVSLEKFHSSFVVIKYTNTSSIGLQCPPLLHRLPAADLHELILTLFQLSDTWLS